MIIGRCIWGKTDEDKDILEIYKVFDAPRFGPMVLEKPVCRLTEVIQQDKLDSVYIKGTPGYLDEIRVGPTRNSVILGIKPLEDLQDKPR